MHIFLIRHGESITNTGENYVNRIPDHLVTLTARGVEQAQKNGAWLADYCNRQGVDLSRARIWRSPYLRTRQTADEFNKFLKISDVREDITLVEQQYGLFDAIPDGEWARLYPNEYAEYTRQCSNLGKFYARLPLGESPFDVAIRVHQFMGTIHRDLEKHGVDARVLCAVEMNKFCEYFTRDTADRYLNEGKVVIIAGGTGNPYFSTDTGVVLRGVEIEADAVLMAKNVDGIYSADPNVDPSAVKFDELTYDEVLARHLKATDSTAMTLAMDNNMTLVCFALKDPYNIVRVVRGEQVGTVVKN